jgi:hypothetical protein
MNIIEEIRNEKQQLESIIAKQIRAFEDKYECLSITEINIGRYPNAQFDNYNQTYAKINVKIEGIT